MNINEQIKQLYAEYAEGFGGERVAVDGVVDEDTFVSSKYRVMALLKEAHDEDKKIDDWSKYVNFICKEARDDREIAHWNNLNYWMEALYNPEKSFVDSAIYTDKQYKYNNDLNINMLKVAIVNIKKTLGESNSKDGVIKKHTEQNKELLVREIRLIAPRLVLCGGTYKYAKMIFGIKDDKYLPCGLAYSVVKDGKNKMLVLDYLHPSVYGVRACILYTFIKVAFSEAREVMIKEKIIS